jgi:Cu2+-exporting ATPase
MCCAGCQAVCSLIIDSGQGDYYRFREGNAVRVDPALLEHLSDWEAFDSPDDGTVDGELAEANLLIEGIHCSACAWLIESQLRALPGIARVSVDAISREACVAWDPRNTSLGTALKQLVKLGYRPHPVSPGLRLDLQRRERGLAIRRLGVAGLGMMQVMMYAIGTYFSDAGLDSPTQRLLEIVSMLVATPVVLYSGGPFFRSALLALRAGQINMDVPVALALGLAYLASCYNLLVGHGTVWFDSISMFVFFLLLGRFVEMSVRHQSATTANALAALLPDVALLLDAQGQRPVPRDQLVSGDRVRVRHGDAFPADGSLLSEHTVVDEALLTGESRPCDKLCGESLMAGSVNMGEAIEMRVETTGEALVISQIERLLQQARGRRPQLARLADRIASRFVIGMLVLAGGVYLYWMLSDASIAFQTALSVLVITCPCALSLATPSALAAAAARLTRSGLLVFDTQGIETLAHVDRVLFDKTGTLTSGRPRVSKVNAIVDHPEPLDRQAVLRLIAILESASNHPLARAFAEYQGPGNAVAVEHFAGLGLEGEIEGRALRVGSAAFVEDWDRAGLTADRIHEGLLGEIYLADQNGLLGAVQLDDELRPDGQRVVADLHRLGVTSQIASGDRSYLVGQAANSLGIERHQGELLPADKLQLVETLQQQGHTVLAVGDGVNDAPVLSGADVAVAMGSGAALAHSGADLVLVGSRLEPLVEAVNIARRTRRVIRQNLAWALAYNLLAVPLAASGLVMPWMAAIGMSASSLIVVLNARRLVRHPRRLASNNGSARSQLAAAQP